MIDNAKIGRRIALLRKGKGITQEQMAARLSVTSQAISKWENGNALPDISLLPELGRLLGTSIDFLLTPYDLFILEARYGISGAFVDVTIQLNSSVDQDGLCFVVSNATLGADPAPGLYKYLIVRYANREGTFFAYSGEGCGLHLSPGEKGMPVTPNEEMEILSGRYGCELLSNDVTANLAKYIRVFKSELVTVNHEWFSSPPAVTEAEHLSVLYRNRDGVFTVTVQEGGALGISKDGHFLYETLNPRPPSNSRRIQGVPKLEWGKGQDCSFAGALTAALHALGQPISYDQVMGMSGACWRLALSHPYWDPSSVDGLVVYDHATPVFKALGYELKGCDRVEKKDREKVRAEIVASIDRGVPVLAIDLRVVPEWGVICGYSDDGKTLWCRTYFDENAADYAQAEKWPFIILFFGAKQTPLSAEESLRQSLGIYVEEMNITERRGYRVGYQAYEAWCSGLEDDARFAGMQGAELLRWVGTNHFCYLSLVDARRAGAAYLESCLGLMSGEAAGHLSRAAQIYSQIAGRLVEGWSHVPTEEGSSGNPHEYWTPEKRHCQAELLREILAMEKQVEAEFRAVL